MGIPQILMIILFSMSVAISMVNHGKTETKTVDAKITITSIILQSIILYFGGFWQ